MPAIDGKDASSEQNETTQTPASDTAPTTAGDGTAVDSDASESPSDSAAASSPRKPLRNKKVIIIVAAVVAAIAIVAALGISSYIKSTSGVSIDAQTFPDDVFRAYVARFDLNGNGKLSDEEIEKVTTIDISRDVSGAEDMADTDTEDSSSSVGIVSDVTGVQVFKDLLVFNAANNDVRVAIDLSNLDKLEQCDVSGNTHLAGLSLPDTFNEKRLKIANNIVYSIGGKRAKKITYSYTTQLASESTYEFANSGEQAAFTYPVLTSDVASTFITSFNASLKAAVTAAAAAEYQEGVSTAADATYRYCNYSVSYFKNGVISIREDSRTTLGGSHDSITTTGLIENLKTGEEITPETTLGISKSELDEATKSAVQTYMAKYPNTSYWNGKTTTAADSLTTYLTEGKISYYAIGDGIVACIPTYCLGDSNAGHPEIFVAAFDETTSTHKAGDRIDAVEGAGDAAAGTMTVGVRQ